MRKLGATAGAFGALVGLAAAVLVHVLPLGQISFFAYVPELGPGGFIPKASFELNWLPSLWALPLLGLVLGVLTGTVAHRMGWRLQRPADPSTGESPGLTA
ncbi:hypothetical protein [Actinomycetospora soli]|uniref:hypothetical protein n=1 Tax=Actinomycetospora soli TaxID=2893887 RepID=UPI001E62D620|nr:hypothetical protein [Actinomycetospora soli]MCD2191319.1 hypothetical protein [Actinomycetospora soli]